MEDGSWVLSIDTEIIGGEWRTSCKDMVVCSVVLCRIRGSKCEQKWPNLPSTSAVRFRVMRSLCVCGSSGEMEVGSAELVGDVFLS